MCSGHLGWWWGGCVEGKGGGTLWPERVYVWCCGSVDLGVMYILVDRGCGCGLVRSVNYGAELSEQASWRSSRRRCGSNGLMILLV